jgi:hypothetical protein
MEQIAPGIHRWSAPHPEWRPHVEEVMSYALVDGEALALVDPLLPAADDARRAPLLADFDRLVGAARRLELLITIPYHTRSAESLYERYSRALPTLIWGHAGVKKRLTRLAPLEAIPQSASGEAAEIADGAVLAYTIGKPRRSEHPLYFPRLRAVAFGDAVVGTAEGPRFWNQSSSTGAAWYRDVFAPTLRPLAEQDIEYVLVTHGPAVLKDGRRALAECLAAAPVDLY